MLDRFAKWAGSLLILIGIAGFIAPLTPNGELLGVFMVDPLHNMIHLISGAVLFAVGFSSNCVLMRRTVLAFAAIYGLLAILGSFSPVVLGMRLNLPDNMLHLGIMVFALLFALPERHLAR